MRRLGFIGAALFALFGLLVSPALAALHVDVTQGTIQPT